MASIPDDSGVTLRLGAPSSFMNRSGTPIAAMLSFYKIPTSQLIVVHDDLDLAATVVRLKFGGGHAGHNGLRDIAKVLGTTDFFRVRVGIGRPEDRRPAADYVLGAFSASEEAALPDALNLACRGAAAIVVDGLLAAQNLIHPLS
jgi:peptidyl-tRNA hydrolase, PTH1 family